MKFVVLAILCTLWSVTPEVAAESGYRPVMRLLKPLAPSPLNHARETSLVASQGPLHKGYFVSQERTELQFDLQESGLVILELRSSDPSKRDGRCFAVATTATQRATLWSSEIAAIGLQVANESRKTPSLSDKRLLLLTKAEPNLNVSLRGSCLLRVRSLETSLLQQLSDADKDALEVGMQSSEPDTGGTGTLSGTFFSLLTLSNQSDLAEIIAEAWQRRFFAWQDLLPSGPATLLVENYRTELLPDSADAEVSTYASAPFAKIGAGEAVKFGPRIGPDSLIRILIKGRSTANLVLLDQFGQQADTITLGAVTEEAADDRLFALLRKMRVGPGSLEIHNTGKDPLSAAISVLQSKGLGVLSFPFVMVDGRETALVECMMLALPRCQEFDGFRAYKDSESRDWVNTNLMLESWFNKSALARQEETKIENHLRLLHEEGQFTLYEQLLRARLGSPQTHRPTDRQTASSDRKAQVSALARLYRQQKTYRGLLALSSYASKALDEEIGRELLLEAVALARDKARPVLPTRGLSHWTVASRGSVAYQQGEVTKSYYRIAPGESLNVTLTNKPLTSIDVAAILTKRAVSHGIVFDVSCDEKTLTLPLPILPTGNSGGKELGSAPRTDQGELISRLIRYVTWGSATCKQLDIHNRSSFPLVVDLSERDLPHFSQADYSTEFAVGFDSVPFDKRQSEIMNSLSALIQGEPIDRTRLSRIERFFREEDTVELASHRDLWLAMTNWEEADHLIAGRQHRALDDAQRHLATSTRVLTSVEDPRCERTLDDGKTIFFNLDSSTRRSARLKLRSSPFTSGSSEAPLELSMDNVLLSKLKVDPERGLDFDFELPAGQHTFALHHPPFWHARSVTFKVLVRDNGVFHSLCDDQAMIWDAPSSGQVTIRGDAHALIRLKSLSRSGVSTRYLEIPGSGTLRLAAPDMLAFAADVLTAEPVLSQKTVNLSLTGVESPLALATSAPRPTTDFTVHRSSSSIGVARHVRLLGETTYDPKPDTDESEHFHEAGVALHLKKRRFSLASQASARSRGAYGDFGRGSLDLGYQFDHSLAFFVDSLIETGLSGQATKREIAIGPSYKRASAWHEWALKFDLHYVEVDPGELGDAPFSWSSRQSRYARLNSTYRYLPTIRQAYDLATSLRLVASEEAAGFADGVAIDSFKVTPAASWYLRSDLQLRASLPSKRFFKNATRSQTYNLFSSRLGLKWIAPALQSTLTSDVTLSEGRFGISLAISTLVLNEAGSGFEDPFEDYYLTTASAHELP